MLGNVGNIPKCRVPSCSAWKIIKIHIVDQAQVFLPTCEEKHIVSPVLPQKNGKKTHMYITPKSQKPLWRLFKHIVPTLWTSCPWDSWPQCSRIPLCWACHPHPLCSVHPGRLHQGYGSFGGLQPTKMIEHCIPGWNLIFKSLVLRGSAVGFWGKVALNQESSGVINEMQVIFDAPISFDESLTHHKSLKQANISHLTVNSVELGESGRLQPTYLCSARKVSTVFKHSPSTCSNTCAGRILAQG